MNFRRLTEEKKYIDMIHILNGIEKFSLTNYILTFSRQKNPLNVLLRNRIVSYTAPVYSSYSSRHLSKDHYSQLLPAINLLCNKGFYLSGIFPNNCSPDRNQTRLMVDCLLLLDRFGIKANDSIPRNNLIKTALAKTPLWQTIRPKLTSKAFPLASTGVFTNYDLNHERYEAYRQYFIKVDALFSDPLRCLGYLKPIEEQLSKQVVFNSDNFQSEAWITSGCLVYPLPPPNFQTTKKNNTLRTLLITSLSGSGELGQAEINLLKSGDFWNTFGFIDEEIADKLISNGEMFWELGYAQNGNVHGSATHPLQIAIMIRAHLQGDITFPCHESIQDVLEVMVSKKMRYNNDSIWSTLFDRAEMENFRSPIYMQSFMMNAEAEALCPTLSFYFRESFWRHYLVTSKHYELEIEGQILLDILANGLFTNEMRFGHSHLLSYYREKQVTLEYYPHSHTLFKKQRPPLLETPHDDIKSEIRGGFGC